ncbi:MAG: hypothetical protein EXS05_18330 [Planctomycetaceae bacterium]|nr:hypothetical protein [Planctomycetaceae bacterium]
MNGNHVSSSAREILMYPGKAVIDLSGRLKPRGTYPQTTKFGIRFWSNEQAKRLVASYVAKKLVRRGTEVFLGDGSSALWVMVAILELDLDVTVVTNNLAIASERLFWEDRSVRVSIAQGAVNREYAGIYGTDAANYCEDASAEAQMAIVPITFLTYEKGPCAGDANAKRIKKRVIQNATELILICDASKIGNEEYDLENMTAPVFGGTLQRFWENVRDNVDARHLVCDGPSTADHDFLSEIKKFQDNGRWTVHLLNQR